MAEFLYTKLIGQVDPKQPNQSFNARIPLLRLFGVWFPESKENYKQEFYKIYSILFRTIFIYIFAFCEIVWIVHVTDIREFANALFLLITELGLIYKLNKFYKNRDRIRAAYNLLNSPKFCPKLRDENSIIRSAMITEVFLYIIFIIPAALTCITMLFMPFFMEELKFFVPAWYPVDTTKLSNFIIFHIYQFFGVCTSALSSISTDTMAVGLLLHGKAQIERLGIMVSKIGHEKEFEINLNNGENRKQMIECIKFHREILGYIQEVEDIFKGPVFVQFAISSLIICMTLVILADQESFIDMFSLLMYLVAIVIQILLYCWAGNEIIYSSNCLSEKIYFSNFTTFNHSTARTMIFFMQRTSKEAQVQAGSLFKVTLSLQTFMAILKSSYSYFTLLRTLQNK